MVVAVFAALTLAALVATQLGYTQRLLDVARYRIQMVGVPELTETTIAPQPATHLSMANWEKVSLPVPASQIHSFSADPSDPDALLVCGFSVLETSPIHGEMTPRGPIAIWLSRDAGKSWTRSQALAITGTFCWISRAPDEPQRLTVEIERPAPIDPNCSQYDVLLSDDNGAHWHATPTSYTAFKDAVRYCSHSAFTVRGRLFLHTYWTTGLTEADSHTVIAHSDDNGRVWLETNGDAAQLLQSRFTVLANGTILTVRWPPQQENPANDSTLWSSQDRGDSWHPLSKLRGVVPIQPLMPFGATSASGTSGHPLYLSAGSFIPSRMLYLKAVEVVDDHHWAYLPPLPAPGTSANHVGISSILGVTASGKLLAFGVNPQTGIQTDKPLDEQFDQQWLWSWDAQAACWTSLTPPLPVAWKVCSDGCWQASLAKNATSHETVPWVRGFVAKDGANDHYRLALPAEIA